MTETKLVDFSTAKCEVHYGHAYLTGTIIHPELEWHFEGDATCTIISQHEMLVNGMHFSGDKHYITLRLDISSLVTTTPDMEKSPGKIVQGGKYQSVDTIIMESLMEIMSISAISYLGTGKSITLEFSTQASPDASSASTGNPCIQLKAEYDYTHPFIIKAPYGHRLELQLANSDLEIRTITKYKPAWHNNEDPLPTFIKDVNLADAQIASKLMHQIMWIEGNVDEFGIITAGYSGVLYWLTLSQEGREKLNQATTYNVPLTVRDMTAGTTLQVPLFIAITEK